MSIVELNKLPKNINEIYREDKSKFEAIQKGASIRLHWEGNLVTLYKIPINIYPEGLAHRTDAKKKKLKIADLPSAYQIQFNNKIALLYEIIK